jgi:hypothetical protein
LQATKDGTCEILGKQYLLIKETEELYAVITAIIRNAKQKQRLEPKGKAAETAKVVWQMDSPILDGGSLFILYPLHFSL